MFFTTVGGILSRGICPRGILFKRDFVLDSYKTQNDNSEHKSSSDAPLSGG